MGIPDAYNVMNRLAAIGLTEMPRDLCQVGRDALADQVIVVGREGVNPRRYYGAAREALEILA